MITTRVLQLSAIALTISLSLGCQNKGPTPKEGAAPSGTAPGVGTTETTGAHPGGTQDPHAGLADKDNPHAGMAQDPSPHGAPATSGLPDSSGMIDVGAIAFRVPSKWQVQSPTSSMRRAQLSASGASGPAELIVYFFGPEGAGTADANIERWVGQFTNTDGSPVSDVKKTSSKVSSFDVARVEVAGQYAGGMGASGQPGAAKSDQRLIAAIVETPGGPYYFKFLGSESTVKEQAAAFDELISSIALAP